MPQVSQEDIDEQIESLRERMAELRLCLTTKRLKKELCFMPYKRYRGRGYKGRY